MFEVHTTDTDRLRRIAAAGGAAIVLGLVMMLLNLVMPFFASQGYDAGNAVFGLFGAFVVLMATHPTYQAAERLGLDET
jgi:membrane associated rhomboid family serine protease